MKTTKVLFAACVLAPSLLAAQPGATQPEPVLAGPSVAATAPEKPASLVAYGADGRLKVPETTPEAAGVDLLGLSAKEREPVDALLRARAAGIDRFVIQNTDLLTQLGNATDDKKAQLAILYKAFLRLRPVLHETTLEVQVREALPEASRERFDSLMREFWNAVAKERCAIRKPDGKYPGRIEAIASARLELLGKEIERSFQRMTASGDFIYSYLTRGIRLRDEQAARIRPLVDELAKRGDSLTEKEKGRSVLAVLAVLDPDQQKQFVANLRGIGPAKPRTPPPAADAKEKTNK